MDAPTSEAAMANGKEVGVLGKEEEEGKETKEVVINGKEEERETKKETVVNGKEVEEDKETKKETVVNGKEEDEEETKEKKQVNNEMKNEEDNKTDESDDDDDDDDDDDPMSDEEEEEEEEEDEEEEKSKILVVDLEMLRDNFTAGAEGEVPLASYVKAFTEMNKFIKMLGNFFHFVAFDIKRKLGTLRKKMAGENSQHYVDLRTMVKFETENKLIGQRKSLSGSEALLALHRGLEFTLDFMKELLVENEEPEFGEAASKIYLATTGKYHTTILREPFSYLLKKMLPSRATVRSMVAKEKQEAEGTLKRQLPEAIGSLTDTYNACHKIFHDNNLLSLP